MFYIIDSSHHIHMVCKGRSHKTVSFFHLMCSAEQVRSTQHSSGHQLAQRMPHAGMAIAGASRASDGSIFLASSADAGVRCLRPVPFLQQVLSSVYSHDVTVRRLACGVCSAAAVAGSLGWQSYSDPLTVCTSLECNPRAVR